MTELEQLIHNGVRVLEIEHKNLHLIIDDEKVKLTPKQEQMAIAWVKKLSTDYVDDPLFRKNFFEDFTEVLDESSLTDDDIDFSPVIDYVEKERQRKANMSKEEKKAAREKRKEKREELKEKYGYAILNGERVEIANWTAEPSSIFMGRGEHPLRGKWKEGPREEDIILNLSPDAPRPEGNWKEIVWEPGCIWVAKWEDKLSGKMKYVWLSDSAPIKQDREIQKFNHAKRVGNHLTEIRKRIKEGLESKDKQIRKIATACYLIDRLNLRVGDEKDDASEADTVGATTLRPEHITINGEEVHFNFLGKDCVEWNKSAVLAPKVIEILQELMAEAEERDANKPQIFNGIGSKHVNAFLGEILENLTAKDFRTYHATHATKSFLDEADVDSEDPEYTKKEIATMANREAAIICNHVKQVSKAWPNRVQRFRERKERAQERIRKAKEYKAERMERLAEVKQQLKERRELKKQRLAVLKEKKAELGKLSRELDKSSNEEEQKKLENEIKKMKKQVKRAKKKVETARKRVKTGKKYVKKAKKSIGRAKERLYKANEYYNKVLSQEKVAKKTKTWNLGTSLKSYIDPRVYYEWGQEVDYDWKNYYPKKLCEKFSWVERDDED
ncbi:MAG: DNA topoisomerase I [Candidatus Heimdallarchaeota archaeon]|nr:DNA topoisomerase I [Candidatus Heimdallarchaeota archaeon]